jgi:hypothetical protein
MTLFILQITLITTIAVAAGVALGWWANIYYRKEQEDTLKKELQLLKSYFSESLKENSKVKLQLKLAEEKIDVLGTNKASVIDGVDFEAYQIFENTVKEARMRKYLN